LLLALAAVVELQATKWLVVVVLDLAVFLLEH
jgi:hypothetical protein